MNILATGVRAFVLPFEGGENDEQMVRAGKLEKKGLLKVIRSQDLEPDILAANIVEYIKNEAFCTTVDLQGTKKTAALLKEFSTRNDSLIDADIRLSHNVRKTDEFNAFENALRPVLERSQKEKKEVNIFLRDDDVDENEETLLRLLDISLSQGVPLNLEVIPDRVTESAIRLLKDHKRYHPKLVELNQHGCRHVNHEIEGKKCEFGVSRSFCQQLGDISRGKAILEKIFGDNFYPVFTPPWNRCTDDTFKVLEQLQFKALSKDIGKHPVIGYSFQEISTTFDLYRWKGNTAMKSMDEIKEALIFQIEHGERIGILLHHKVMDENAFNFLHFLIYLLKDYKNITFCTFQEIILNQINRDKKGL